MKEFWKEFWKNIIFSVITVGIITLVGYFWLVKENKLRIEIINQDITNLKQDISYDKKLLETIINSQILNKFKFERLIDENKKINDNLQRIEKHVRALIWALQSQTDIKLDYKFFLSLNNYLGKLPIEQSIEIAKKIHERDEIIKNIKKYSIDDRLKIATKFLEDIDKYDLSYNDKTAITDHLFNAPFGVGGGE